MVSKLGKRRVVGSETCGGCATGRGSRTTGVGATEVGASAEMSAQPSSFTGASPGGDRILSKSWSNADSTVGCVGGSDFGIVRMKEDELAFQVVWGRAVEEGLEKKSRRKNKSYACF